MAKFKLIYILSIIVLIVSCSSYNKPECVNRNLEHFTLSWGVIDSNHIAHAFRLDSKGYIYEYTEQLDNKKVLSEKELLRIDGPEFCKHFDRTTITVLKVSVLNVPAKLNHFVEYNMPDNNFYKRALWDPHFENKGNKDFKELMNYLLNLIDKNDLKDLMISQIKK